MAVVVSQHALTTVLAATGAAKTAKPGGGRAASPQTLSLATRIAVLASVLESIGTTYSGLQDLLDDVNAVVNEQFDDVQRGPEYWRDLNEAVDRTLNLAFLVAPPISGLTDMEDPARWLPGVAQRISRDAVKARGSYANALRRAWSAGGFGVEHVLADADAQAAKLPKRVVELYVGPDGVWQQIVQVGTLRDQLLAMKAASGHPTSGTGPLNDVGIASLAPGSTEWILLKLLTDDHTQALVYWQNSDHSAGPAINALSRRLQLIMVTLTALTLDEQLSTFGESLLLQPAVALRGRLQHARDLLAPVLGTLHACFGDPATTGQAAALSTLRLLTDDIVLQSDITTALTTLQIAKTAEEVLLVAVIATAAGLTAGYAGAFAGSVIGAFAGDATIAGLVTWTSLGSVAVNVFVLTAVTRYGNELVFGPGAVNSPFWQDMLWNALSLGAAKLITIGVAAKFGRLRTVWPAGFKALAGTVEQVSMFGFGEVQRLVTSGDWASGEQRERAALDQIVQLVLGALSGRLIAKLSERQPPLGIAATDLAAADQRNVDLAALLTKVREGTATEPEILSVPGQIETVRNEEVALLHQVPDSQAKVDALAIYSAEVAEVELRMAMLGLAAGLAVPGQQPAFAPRAPGVIAVSEAGEPVLDTFVKDRDAALVDGPAGTELQKLSLPTGEVALFGPAGTSQQTSPPTELTLAGNDALNDAATSEFGAAGLANLSRLFTGKTSVESILNDIRGGGSEQVGEGPFLRMMAHPEFATLTGNPAADAIVAIGSNGELRDFAGLYGPKLALAIRSKLKFGGNGTSKEMLGAYRRAENLLDSTAEADRPALIAQLMVMPARALRIMLGTAKVAKRRTQITQENAGVDPASAQWRGIYARIQAEYPARTNAQWRAHANLEQMLERAKTREYNGMAFDDKRNVLSKFDTYCSASGIIENDASGQPLPGPRNNKYGAMAEWLFLPRGAAGKIAFFGGVFKNVPLNKIGGTVPDAWDWLDSSQTSGVQTEFKANLDPRSVAPRHYTEAVGDKTNIPAGSEIQIHYVHEPTVADQLAIIALFSKTGSPINRVQFGNKGWIKITPLPGP